MKRPGKQKRAGRGRLRRTRERQKGKRVRQAQHNAIQKSSTAPQTQVARRKNWNGPECKIKLKLNLKVAMKCKRKRYAAKSEKTVEKTSPSFSFVDTPPQQKDAEPGAVAPVKACQLILKRAQWRCLVVDTLVCCHNLAKG